MKLFQSSDFPSSRKIIVQCLTFFIVILFLQSGYAQSAGKRTALIIGVGEYGYAGAAPLDGVKYDVSSAANIASAMGIPEQNITFLKNSEATKSNILNALKTLGGSTSEGSRAFVYFSGHGTRQQVGNECVEGLLTYEGQTITNQEFAAATQKLAKTADKVLTMIDACHSEGIVPPRSQTRALLQETFTPKFFMKSGGAPSACSVIANYKTRGLLPEVTKLGAIQENFVQISSSRPDEVSFDEAGKGGLATQGVRDCLLGQAKDMNKSGAVSLQEVQQCAQQFVNNKLRNVQNVTPHHITVTGNRNLIPVQRPPMVVAVAPVEPPKPVLPTPAASVAAPAQAPAPSPAPVQAPPPVAPPVAILPPSVTPEPIKITPQEPILASLATLKDIEQQRNPKRLVEVKLSKTAMKIGKDSLDMSIKSNHDGYIYMILLGSDAKSFYVLYPNGLDKNNAIKAGQTVRVPKPDWEVKAVGPVGTNNLLVMVSDSPRKLNTLTMAEPTAAEPFTYALNDIGGRSALISFLTSQGLDGKSESFGAKLVAIKEVK
ncbi:caspase family protein [Limnohabitans sp. Rim8]|uniref:caspase family protein n=1 Tax=Limnohabitans sp. Rim8 TaxID=1100718 RepID=UPI0025D0BE59|nr:caspase family protein [Limnohabitans sp. Rim8]